LLFQFALAPGTGGNNPEMYLKFYNAGGLQSWSIIPPRNLLIIRALMVPDIKIWRILGRHHAASC
jgi:hypothetical protein